ncbi:tetratricopeptide repeat protein [Agaribacterium sp. ZY112]|uniref:tetratricopeptide repeat protein n=1 Tax=Agaribacterium sp. ZY112 TaxID=3233574 RepID=UPI0035252892
MKISRRKTKWIHKRIGILFFLLFFTFSLTLNASQTWADLSIQLPVTSTNSATEVLINEALLLELDAHIKNELDLHIRPIRKKSERAQALHKLMFSEQGWNIDYAFDESLSARDTYYRKQGNCLSLALLYVASARYVGLKAYFQNVNVAQQWRQASNVYLVPGHINAVVKTRNQRIYIEFLGTFFNIADIDPRNSRVISDQRALADYYNNIAMQNLEHKQWQQAQRHMKKALALAPKEDFFWSNLGVLNKLSNKPIEAEKAYKKALKINKRNDSALSNLYVLLLEQERLNEAEKLAKKVGRYSRKNPYHLAKLAQKALTHKHYQQALDTIQKAITIAPKEQLFHHLSAQIHFAMGNKNQSIQSLKKAYELSEGLQKQRFEGKLQGLLSMR